MNNNTLGAKFVFSIFILTFLTVVCAVAQSGGVYYLEKGRLNARKGEIAEAINDFTLAAALTPDNPDIYNARGIAYEKCGDYAAARADYEHALSINPGSAEALHNLRNLAAKIEAKETSVNLPPSYNGSSYSHSSPAYQPWRESAVRDTAYSSASNPKTNLSGQAAYTGSTARGSASGVQPNFTPDASRQYQTLSPNAYDSLFRQTLPAQKSARPSEEFGSYSSVQSWNRPQVVGAPAAKARIPARSALDQQIFIDPVAESYNLQGTKLNEYGRFNEAILQFSEAVKIYPEYAIAYNNRGVAFANMGDFFSAAADFKKALRLNPYYRDAQFNHERTNNWIAQR
jgi:Flp pilus assembly protein TadD